MCSRVVLIARILAQSLVHPLYSNFLQDSLIFTFIKLFLSFRLSYVISLKYLRLWWPWRQGPPLPIPNREVKPASADGTAPKGGRVGRRHPQAPHSNVRGFFYTLFLGMEMMSSYL